MTRSSAERRAHARFARSFEIEGAASSDGSVARMVASDLSLGGLYCSSSSDFPVMTRLAVRLLLPTGMSATPPSDPLDAEAVVVRRRRLAASAGGPRFELALFFTSMSDGDRQRLARYLGRGDS